jgi:lipopolysaccharide/colanic/teichoic acid biosynthesis glycosyltransferase
VLKRSFDLFFSFVGLLPLFPLMVVVGLLIKLDSPGSIIYKSKRVGKNGRLFEMYKFRTMVMNADSQGPLVTAGDDCRMTRIGRILRRTKLDELPTLWNVLKGDMSFVGPRPENPKSAELYTEEQRHIWEMRPGITSLATIKYRNEESLLAGAKDLDAKYFEVMQDKLRLELEYVDRHSFYLDLVILFRTILAIFIAKDSNA